MSLADDVDIAQLPEDGVWRIGPATDPYQIRRLLSPDELNSARAGNRFDSPMATYGVLYFGTTLRACFGETLARFRPDPTIAPLLRGEWSDLGFMRPGEVPADWRHTRLAVRVCCSDANAGFLDVESAKTRAVLADRLAPFLAAYDATDLDVAAVRSGDRRITRVISLWAWSLIDEHGNQAFAGIRYLSRLNTDWECWALFHRVATQELERRAITREMEDLQEIAKLWRLTVF